MSPSMSEIVQLAVLAKLNELAALPVGFRSGDASRLMICGATGST